MRAAHALRMLCLLAAACGEGDTPAGHEGEPGAAARPAGPDAFCTEHGVAEAVCPRCNPRLEAVFRAQGDWCEDHGYPESFCPTCRPEAGGRPAVSVAPDDAPADGTRVQLRTPAAVAAAGIETEAARPPTDEAGLLVLATIVHDAARRAQVNPRLPGVVRELHVGLGARVAAGDPLATIESAELAGELARLASARSRQRLAESSRARAQGLLDIGMATQRDVQEAERELEAAAAEIAASAATLALVGAEESGGASYTLRAPLAGMVTRVGASPGLMVDAGDVLCEVVDASVVWAELDVPEAELGRVALEQEVVLTVDALPGREFRGRIESILPELDPRTRTARARVRLENPDGALRAHMYARARIVLGRSSARALVPPDAVQRARGAAFVFVQLEPARYEARRVRLGARRDGLVEVLDGVEPGEPVATAGSFLLKTETLKGSIGAGCCEVE